MIIIIFAWTPRARSSSICKPPLHSHLFGLVCWTTELRFVDLCNFDLRDVVAGLAHLHELGFVDRDLRPGNVLITCDNSLCAKICDQGTFSTRGKGRDKSPGTRATSEILMPAYEIPISQPLEYRLHAADLFNLGCLIFFVITKGSNLSDRSLIEGANVAKSYCNFTSVENVYEAAHLISNFLHLDPTMRLSARKVLVHPFFWDSKKRGSFLLEVTDWLECKGRKKKHVVNAMMNAAPVVFGGSWDVKMEAWFITFATYHKNYSYDCVLDLLLLIQNTLRHEQPFPKDIQVLIGSTQGEIYDCFASLFPKLLIEVFDVMYEYCLLEDVFLRNYFEWYIHI